MRITTRLKIISTATLAALAVLAPVLVWSFVEFRSAKNDYALADAIKANFFESASFRDQYFLYREDRARTQWDKSRQTADHLLQQAVAQFQWEQNWQTLERLRRNADDSAIIFRRIVDNSEAMKTAAANRHVYEELDKRLSSQLLLKAAEIRDAAADLQEASARRAERTYEYLAAVTGSFAIMLALATILVALHLGRLIRKRLAPLHDGAKIVAGGDLGYRIKCGNSDEFDELALSINAMTDRLQAFTLRQEAEISARKQAEKGLREKSRILDSIVESIPNTIFLKRASDLRYTLFNRAGEALLGCNRSELLGRNDYDFFPKEQADLFTGKDRAALGRDDIVDIPEEPIETPHGTRILHTRKLALRDEHGQPQYLLGISEDITERNEYEEELKRSNIELEQFSYAVSHDMRQPLRMISSYLQLIEMELAGELDAEKRGYFDFAIEGAKRIEQMLVALLEYSRVGRMGDAPEWIESSAILDEALLFLQPAIVEAQARLDTAGDWPRIFAKRDEMLRLMQNLIGNAVKFRAAGRTPEISVTGEVVRNEWHLCVADNGVGIIPDQIQRLFQVFQRLQLRTAYEGNGVGLALCRKIAEHHKGRIWAESAGEGRGSRFYVVLPAPQEGK